MNYLKAVLKKDHNTKISELKKLIKLGEKLKKDTTPDKKKLEILLERESKKVKNNTKTSSTKVSNNGKHSISSVYTSNNTIVVNFKKNVNKEFIKFFELNQNPIYKDVFDLKGNFKDARPTKLKIKGIDKISIGQFRNDTLRIVFAHNKNLKTTYKVNKKQIIITVKDIKSNKKIIAPRKKEIDNIEKDLSDKFIDTTNSIRNIYTNENKIHVIFNKDFSKKMLKYTAFKSNNLHNDIFDIKGKYKYTKPLKLKIDNVQRIIVSDRTAGNIRIKVLDKKNYRFTYYIKKRELIIKITGITSKKVSTLPYANFQSKTIVIDAGHGGKDVGAVGPNKKYEKVVTLKIAKYLYSILKQRGHKVHLTRTKDRFIKVGRRTDLALRKNADVFISIHANAVPKSSARKVSGIETYYLSPAKTERAKRVAAKENKMDIRKMSASTSKSFLSSLNSPKLRYSRLLSIDIQREMLSSVRTKHKVKDKGSRPGPFWVLLDAPQASVLVEVGYISHPQESKKLYNSEYQKLLAKGMANGIDAYFEMKARFD